MLETKLSSRGQMVLPKEIRELQGWLPGQVFEVALVDGEVRLRAKSDERVRLGELVGAGRGVFGSAAVVDEAIEGERRSWDR